MANFIRLAVCALLSLEIVNGQPISPEDVVSLLPDIPKTKNETVAAIVQDAVIQNAVQSVVGNGTLSGLVVKKNTVILPADKPDVILTQNEQILMAPLSHLEEIRKNITETVASMTENENSEVAAIDEVSLSELVPLDGKAPENPLEILTADSLVLDPKDSSTKLPEFVSEVTIGEKFKVPGILQSDSNLPGGVISENISLPVAIHDGIAEPVVAVWNPDSLAAVQESVIDLLPDLVESTSTGATGGGSSNPDEKNREVPEYGTRIPVKVVNSEELEHPAVKIEERSYPDEEKAKKLVAASFLVPEEKSSYYQNDDNDMVAAEDIIFRPLFRYRQQQNDRLRILENRSYQKTGYNRHRQGSLTSSFENSNSRKNYYRKPQRTRYYNDYYS